MRGNRAVTKSCRFVIIGDLSTLAVGFDQWVQHLFAGDGYARFRRENWQCFSNGFLEETTFGHMFQHHRPWNGRWCWNYSVQTD